MSLPSPRRGIEAIVIPLVALVAALILFGIFLRCCGVDPFEAYGWLFRGGFGTQMAWQRTLQVTAPLLLAGLCTALPARLGMVIIGGEGALALGALAAAGTAHVFQHSSPMVVMPAMAIAGICAGGSWIMLAGALRYYRGVNETISSLLLTYIAIAIFNHLVEGPWRDPATTNKPSTWEIGVANMIGKIPGLDVHWGLLIGVVVCLVFYVLIQHTTFGFSARIVGGNLRAARIAGLSVGQLTLLICFLAGAAAGLAGMIEVAAVQKSANAPGIIVGYGYTGILVAFMARHSPLGIIPVALLLGGINASNGKLQIHMNLPDATVLVLQGILFVLILASESFYGRFKIFQPRTEDKFTGFAVLAQPEVASA